MLKPKDNAIFAQNKATHSFLILQTNQMITRDLIKISPKTEEDIIFQYGIKPRSESNAIKEQISQGLKSISELEKESLKTIETLNEEIDCLTNHADTTDYIFSACSGILCGLIDSFFVGEISLDNCAKWGKDKVDSFVKKIAQNQGCESPDLKNSVKFLEDKFPIPADKATNFFGGGLQHHLRDFSHHPNLIGLSFSLITQFTGRVYGTNTSGMFCSYEIEDKTLIGKDIPTKFSIGITSWFFHMVSDMAGSSSSLAQGKYGTGLPGPVVSFLKMLSSLPFFQSEESTNEFSKFVSRLFNGTLLAQHDASGKILKQDIIKFDLRAEIGLMKELGKQAIPVIINEVLVRLFYFFRRTYVELKTIKPTSFKDFLIKANWKNCLPFKNRTIARMLTVAHGSFVAFDVIDAGIRSAASGAFVDPAIFLREMCLRVNFVGIGRFTIALATDVKMGISKYKKENERLIEVSRYIRLKETELQLHKANMWIEVREFKESQLILAETIKESVPIMLLSIQQTGETFYAISNFGNDIENNNPGLLDDISDSLL